MPHGRKDKKVVIVGSFVAAIGTLLLILVVLPIELVPHMVVTIRIQTDETEHITNGVSA